MRKIRKKGQNSYDWPDFVDSVGDRNEKLEKRAPKGTGKAGRKGALARLAISAN